MGGFQSVNSIACHSGKYLMTLKISFKSLHINACITTISLAVFRGEFEVKVGHKTKRWIGAVPWGGWLAVFLLGKVLFGCREESPGLLSSDVQL